MSNIAALSAAAGARVRRSDRESAAKRIWNRCARAIGSLFRRRSQCVFVDGRKLPALSLQTALSPEGMALTVVAKSEDVALLRLADACLSERRLQLSTILHGDIYDGHGTVETYVQAGNRVHLSFRAQQVRRFCF